MSNNTIFPEVTHLHNLRRDRLDRAIFRPIGAPRPIAPEGYTLWAVHPDGRVVASTATSTVLLNPDDGSITPLIEASIRRASVSEDSITLFTDTGSVTLTRTRDGDFSATSTDFSKWPVTILAEPMAPLTAHFDKLSFSQDYSPGGTLASPDRALTANLIVKTYRELAAAATEQGVFIQPVMARAVIEDSDGNILHKGPKIPIIPRQGTPFDSGITLPMETHGTTEAVSADIPCYRLRVIVPPEVERQSAQRGIRIRIEAASVFHPDFDSLPETSTTVSIVRRGTSDMAVQAVLPGLHTTLSAHDDARSRRNILSCLAHFDAMAETLATINAAMDSGTDTVVPAYALGPMSRQMGARKRRHKPDMTTGRFNAPHSFTARHAASGGNAVVYGDVSRLRYAGYSPADYAASVADTKSAWTAVTTTTYADGSSGVRVCRHYGYRPLTLAPAVYFPDPEAVTIDTYIKDDSQSDGYRCRISLAPDESGEGACHIADGLAPLVPEAAPFPTADAASERRPAPVRLADTLLCAPAANPFLIKASMRAEGDIRHLAPARSTSGAWDFGRNRFYCFTSSATQLLNCSAGADAAALSPLAATGIDDPGAVTSDNTAATYFANSSKFIYRIDGTRVTVLSHLPAPVDRLGFDPTAGILVAGASSGAGVLYHIEPDTGKISATSSQISPFDGMMTAGRHLLMPTQSGLFDIALEGRDTAGDKTDVALYCRTPYSALRGPWNIDRVTCDIDSEAFDGRFSLERLSSARRRAEVFALRLRGRLCAPFTVPVVARPLTGILVRIEGLASADTCITTPSLIYRHGTDNSKRNQRK